MDQQIDVRSIRVSLGLTQKQLAEAVGVDQSTVSNWENGASPRGPARKLIERLVAAPTPSKQEPTPRPVERASA